jgi:predicted nucleotidyltransferase
MKTRIDDFSNTGISEKVVEEIITLAKKHKLHGVVLFGSRARGDFYRTSDIDLAIWGGDTMRFALDVDEETTTLLRYDVVDLDRPVQPELLESIREEGRIIYEKI